ncbi:DNA-formamidopyrimidine glycosylase family protein, partial [Bdellovibrionota bacterium FG-1]
LLQKTCGQARFGDLPKSQLLGRPLAFRSYGKGLFLYEAGAETPLVEFALGMTGQFHLRRRLDKWKRHYFLSISLGDAEVFFADPRRFGRVQTPRDTAFALGGYSEELGFWKITKPRLPTGFLKKSRVSWLLDAGDQTGVGNYMANEALGRLGLSPFEPCRDEREAILLLRKCAAIASASYRRGGNSFGSGYYRLNGAEGAYASRCRFYQNPRVPRTMFRGRPVFTYFVAGSSED